MARDSRMVMRHVELSNGLIGSIDAGGPWVAINRKCVSGVL
jgi:hypothetical protein